MARKTINRKKASATRTGKAKPTTPQITRHARWVCAFDESQSTDSTFALVRSSLTASTTVRLTDIHTGAMRGEHTAQGKIKALAFTTLKSQLSLAVALHTGDIEIYSPARNSVVCTLRGAHAHAISDIAIVPRLVDRGIFSLDTSGLVVHWDGVTGEALASVKTGVANAQRLVVSSDGKRAAIASHKIELWTLGTHAARVGSWPGHTSPVTSLAWTLDESALVTTAEGDRHVHVWDSADVRGEHAPAVLATDSDVVYSDVSSDGSVLAVGADGRVCVWHQVAVARRTSAQSEFGQRADSTLRVASSSGESIAVSVARFSRVAGNDSDVLIVRGSALKPVFETLSITDSQGQLQKEIEIVRDAQTNILIGSSDAEKQLDAQTNAYDEHAARVATPATEAARRAQAAASEPPTLADRIIEQDEVKAGEPQAKAGTLVRVLVQALHTDDNALLESVIRNAPRTAVVESTVLALPTSYVVPFLQQLFAIFHAAPSRTRVIVPWVRAAFALHAAYLTSVPSLVPQLAGFYQSILARLESHDKLLRLSGRLEVANVQIRARNRVADSSKREEGVAVPVNSYVESDEEGAAWQAEVSTDEEADESDSESNDEQWSDDDDDEDNGDGNEKGVESDVDMGSLLGSDEDRDTESDDDGKDLDEYN